MDIVEAAEFLRDKLTSYALKCALNDDTRNIEMDYSEPFVLFMSQQKTGVPIGAIVGALVHQNYNLIKSATTFIEAVVEAGLIRAEKVNNNWIIKPILIDHVINQNYGLSESSIAVTKPYCGNIIHKPQATRTDHLDYLQNIEFSVNEDFIKQFPEIPNNVPYSKTLPGLLKSSEGKSLFLEHRYDTRGRTYCAAHINYQGTEYEKCLLEFTEKRKLNFVGKRNLTVYLENLKPTAHYLRWVAENALASDEPTGTFIGADASASGIQLMAVLRGCIKSAESVGLLADNDFYTLAKETANLVIESNEDPRKVFKECSMQHFYGGVKTPSEKLGEANLPKFYETLEALAPGCERLLEELQSTYWETSVFRWTLPDGFKVQQPVIKTERIELQMPHNPNVVFGYAYKTLITREKGLEMAANVVHSVDAYVARELIYRASFASEDLLGLLPAIEVALAAANTNNEGKVFSLHTLMNTPKHAWPLLGKSFLQKAWNYLKAMPNRPAFTVITIHDDFKCHPNYLHWVKWLYIEILAEIADSSLIKQIIEEINPKLVYNKVPSTELAKLLRFAYVTNSGKGLN